jgi:hypothetical protein
MANPNSGEFGDFAVLVGRTQIGPIAAPPHDTTRALPHLAPGDSAVATEAAELARKKTEGGSVSLPIGRRTPGATSDQTDKHLPEWPKNTWTTVYYSATLAKEPDLWQPVVRSDRRPASSRKTMGVLARSPRGDSHLPPGHADGRTGKAHAETQSSRRKKVLCYVPLSELCAFARDI